MVGCTTQQAQTVTPIKHTQCTANQQVPAGFDYMLNVKILMIDSSVISAFDSLIMILQPSARKTFFLLFLTVFVMSTLRKVLSDQNVEKF